MTAHEVDVGTLVNMLQKWVQQSYHPSYMKVYITPSLYPQSLPHDAIVGASLCSLSLGHFPQACHFSLPSNRCRGIHNCISNLGKWSRVIMKGKGILPAIARTILGDRFCTSHSLHLPRTFRAKPLGPAAATTAVAIDEMTSVIYPDTSGSHFLSHICCQLFGEVCDYVRVSLIISFVQNL